MDSQASNLPAAKVYRTRPTGSAVRKTGTSQPIRSSVSRTNKAPGRALPPLRLKVEVVEDGK